MWDVLPILSISQCCQTGGREYLFRKIEPQNYVFQIQGPNAQQLMMDVTGQSLPKIGFFHLGEFLIEGCRVRGLRHGMAGQPGYEIFGPWRDHMSVLTALEKAGRNHGLRKIGGLAYPTTSIESAWMSLPLPAIYHSEELKPYREWLTLRSLEAIGSLGGSFVSEKLTDYYIDPIEIGYGHLVDGTREFCVCPAKLRVGDTIDLITFLEFTNARSCLFYHS
jgi:vanillate/3-O-methylgallate O-demethylase